MIKYMRVIVLSIIIFLIGLYAPVFIVAIVAGETNFEAVLPYCVANSIIFLGIYLWTEKKYIKNNKKKSC